jgi:hypothetical protein
MATSSGTARLHSGGGAGGNTQSAVGRLLLVRTAFDVLLFAAALLR